ARFEQIFPNSAGPLVGGSHRDAHDARVRPAIDSTIAAIPRIWPGTDRECLMLAGSRTILRISLLAMPAARALVPWRPRLGHHLAERRITMASQQLAAGERSEALAALPEWTLRADGLAIERSFKFENFS